MSGQWNDTKGNTQSGHNVNSKNIDSHWLKHNAKMAFSAQTCISSCVECMAKMTGKQDLASHSAPILATCHPELDESPVLNKEDHAKFRSLVGCANWLVTLGRFNNAFATKPAAGLPCNQAKDIWME